MLNKGTNILEAVKVLSELSSEERHHIKKRDVFRGFYKGARVILECKKL